MPRGLLHGRLAIVLKAAAFAVPLVCLKFLAHTLGWERIDTLPLVTALLGGVIFTLTIILAGVLADFKDSERALSELAGSIRRLHAELGLLAQGERLREMRAELASMTTRLAAALRGGERMRLDEVLAPIDRLDLLVAEAGKAPATPGALGAVQNGITTIVKHADRLRGIMETTFLRAGYAFAGVAVAGALAALTFARVPGLGQALALHFFASYLLVGLLLLIYDLDNPFEGAVRVSTRSLDDVETWLREGPATVPVLATPRA